MDKDFNELISLQMQINKLIWQKSQLSLKDRMATALQFQALSFLQKNQGATLGELSDFLQDSHSSTTQLTDRLEKAGLIERRGDQEDRRIIHLSLTKKGEGSLSQIKSTKLSQLKKIYSLIDKEDLKTLIRIQEKLLENLKKGAR